MTILELGIILCFILICTLGFVVFNLYSKNVKLENVAIRQSNYINTMAEMLKNFKKVAEEIDSKIWVQSDPEFLSLFESIRQIQEEADRYASND
jgi:transposase-like protein